MNLNVRSYLLNTTQSNKVVCAENIQTLWSGYGDISRYTLAGGTRPSVVVKHICFPKETHHPRGWATDLSHSRKVRSYQIETRWYQQWNQACDDDCRTADFIGNFSEGDHQWIVLEDLNEAFPVRKYDLTFSEVKVCLSWLAHFHARFLGKKPNGLWEIGTYWHLDTRPDEWAAMVDSPLKRNAQAIDHHLNSCRFQTIVHGDAKLANFCFSQDGNRVAAVDFQYVGGGCGMKDVVYFLGSCLSGAVLKNQEDQLLKFYFSALRKALEQKASNIIFSELEDEWRRMYPVASADFMRFMMGWMPSHQKINAYQKSLVEKALCELL